MAAFIRLDLFPATVLVGDVRHSPARVVVTDDAVHVYVDGANGPTESYTARLDDFDGRRTIGYTATSSDGAVISIERASGCGCGSQLRGFRPFAGVPQIHIP